MSTQPERPAPSGSRYGIGLFLLTLLIELIGVWPRYLLVRAIFWPVSVLTTGIAIFRNIPLVTERQVVAPVGPGLGFQLLVFLNSLAVPLAHVIAWGPLVFALLTLVFLPGGFLLTRFALGARKPSMREKELLYAALDEVIQGNPNVRAPSAFYVIDNFDPNAYTIGTTLYIHSGLLSEQTAGTHRLGVIAHHLGHRNSLDGRLTLALRRFVIYPVYFLSRSVGTVAPGSFVYSIGRGDAKGCLAGTLVLLVSLFLALAGGGLGTLLLNPLWTAYWRRREFVADEFAQQLKLGGPLMEYLKQHTLQDAATPFFLNPTPSNELRIDRLLHGPDTPSTMPLPQRETRVLFGSLSVVALLGFFWFGGAGAVGFGPRIQNSAWLLESFAYRNGSPVTTESCQVYFDGASTADASCFVGGYASQQLARYTFIDANTILLDPRPGTMSLPIYFGGAYDLRFTGDRLIMTQSGSGYTLTWRRQ